MSDLNYFEKMRLEKLFGMGGGYVLNFSNRTFQEFVADSVQRDIYDGKYENASNSKANLLRKFWELEPNYVVGKLLSDLMKLGREVSHFSGDAATNQECERIVERLLQGAPVEDMAAISEEITEKDFELLVKSIRSSIDANEPESALDRLHTFVTKFLRRLCEKRGVVVTKDKPLHSLLGEYIKKIKEADAIDTPMSERILKSSISTLEAFNSVRNNHSFAHDNPVLNYEESMLIFSHVTSSVRFIQALERRFEVIPQGDPPSSEYDEIPF